MDNPNNPYSGKGGKVNPRIGILSESILGFSRSRTNRVKPRRFMFQSEEDEIAYAKHKDELALFTQQQKEWDVLRKSTSDEIRTTLEGNLERMHKLYTRREIIFTEIIPLQTDREQAKVLGPVGHIIIASEHNLVTQTVERVEDYDQVLNKLRSELANINREMRTIADQILATGPAILNYKRLKPPKKARH